MHLAILADDRAVGVEDDGGVVIDPVGPLLEKRRDDDDPFLAGELRERASGRPGDRLCEPEERDVFLLAEVTRAKELLQTDDVGAVARRTPDTLDRPVQIVRRLVAAAHLHETEGHRAGVLASTCHVTS